MGQNASGPVYYHRTIIPPPSVSGPDRFPYHLKCLTNYED